MEQGPVTRQGDEVEPARAPGGEAVEDGAQQSKVGALDPRARAGKERWPRGQSGRAASVPNSEGEGDPAGLSARRTNVEEETRARG